jgi:hypothetical protein
MDDELHRASNGYLIQNNRFIPVNEQEVMKICFKKFLGPFL